MTVGTLPGFDDFTLRRHCHQRILCLGPEACSTAAFVCWAPLPLMHADMLLMKLAARDQVHYSCIPDRRPLLQGPTMRSVRRLVALTELRLIGLENLVGDIPVAMLASNMPPDLAILQLACRAVSTGHLPLAFTRIGLSAATAACRAAKPWHAVACMLDGSHGRLH